MKKVLSIVLALVFVLGFASMATAMGPTGPDATNVGLVLTSFTVADSIISPLMLQNWSGTLQPTKTYPEGTPIWFVASYVQNKDSNDATELRDFTTGKIESKKTIFTSVDNCVNYAYSKAYMNFALVNGIQAIGASVSSLAQVDVSAKEMEVTFNNVTANPPGGTTGFADYVASNAELLLVADACNVVQNYYLQIMGFTNACNEAQGTAIAKCPIDYNEFTTITAPALLGEVGSLAAAKTATAANRGSWLNIYDANHNIKYSIGKFTLDTANFTNAGLANIGVTGNSNTLYMVYDADGAQIIGFVSTSKAYKGMVKAELNATGTSIDLLPVQYTSDSGGKYAYSAAGAGSIAAGDKAIDKADLQAVMDFFGFNFGNDYPILDKHFEAFAGWWQVLEAKYNVAAAVINVPDPGVDIVPKTGDASTAFGMIMVAIAGLAAVGFVMMKRVRG